MPVATSDITTTLLLIAVVIVGVAFGVYRVCRWQSRHADKVNIKTWLLYQKAWLKNAETHARSHDHISSAHCKLNADRCLGNAKSLGYLTTVFDSDLEKVETLNEQQGF